MPSSTTRSSGTTTPACSLRPHETKFFPQLRRHKAAGFDAVTVNIGFGDVGTKSMRHALEAPRHWLRQHADDYVLLEDVEDAESVRSSRRLVVDFDIEGANGIGDQLSLIEMYRELGVRWMARPAPQHQQPCRRRLPGR
ncbi:MAG: membrane dipeptidase [Rubrivivax sp.]